MLLTWGREAKKWAMPNIEWSIHNWDQLINEKRLSKLDRKWDVIIADESHQAIKNPKAVRCRRFFDYLVPLSERVWLATATPASRSGLDYYCTLKLLLPSMFQSWSTYQFQVQFCQEKYDRFATSGKKYEGFKNTATLKELFSKCAIRHKKAEVLPDLPPKIYTNVEVEVDAYIVSDHLDLDSEKVIDMIENGEPLPGHVAHVMQATAHAKLNDVMEIIENFPENENLVVFAWHRSVVDALIERMKEKGIDCEKITGEINSAEKRQDIVDRFQAGTLKRLVLNMQSGGVGLTLTKAATAIYVEFPHSPTHLVQSENRVHRIGSVSDKVQLIRVIGKGTIDEAIFEALDHRLKAIGEVGV
jgi:SWI/SNF-related matrix-associated actin-dependent regulator 1 of chromatin subfamily A